MPRNTKVLGRGLESLLQGSQLLSDSFKILSVEQIQTNPHQPRKDFDDKSLSELRDSIQQHGIIQPITVRKLNNDVYQLISGERRLQATKLAGLPTIPAYLRTANDHEILEMALIENIQRKNLNPIEIALSYKQLHTVCQIPQEEIGARVGKNRATVNNYLRLLKLPPDIQIALRDGNLSMGHGRALLSVEDPLRQKKLAQRILEEGLSVRDIERISQQLDKVKPKNCAKRSHINLQNHLGIPVHIRDITSGGGIIQLKCDTEAILEKLIQRLQNA